MMISSTKPHSQQPRISHTPNSSSISFPPRPSSSQSTISPPPTPHSSARRPSISTTMHWLSRSPTQSSTITTSSSSPYAAQKPTRISEPKLVRGIDAVVQLRSGVLGSGATVVRTPDEALRETGVRLTYDVKPKEEVQKVKGSKPRKEKKPSISKAIVPPAIDTVVPSISSPPLPPLPVPEVDEERLLTRSNSDSSSIARPRRPRTPPLTSGLVSSLAPLSRSPSLRSSLKIKSSASTDDQSAVPPLPSSVPHSPPPPFKPILVSEIPEFSFDPEKIIVTLETCTTTYRTSLETINSRPSSLAKYINSLLPKHRTDSTASSVYSTESDDLAVYRHHLASQGLVPRPSHNIHIFLDRPSASYAHILTYLRSQPPPSDIPELLPRAVMHQSSSNARLESLLELRDEAAYLDLEGLHKLCTDEIRVRHAPKMHARGNSGSGPSLNSIQSLHASVYTLHTLLERVETDIRSSSHGSDSYRNNNKDNAPEVAPSRSPPTPQSWEGPLRDRNPSPHRPSRTPPAGWI